MPAAPMLLAVTSAAEGAQVLTVPLGASMRRRASKIKRLAAASEARTATLVKVAAVPAPSRKPVAALPAAVVTALGK